MGRLGDLTGDWNRVTAPFMRDFLDPTVSAETWVRDARKPLAKMRAVVAEMNSVALLIEDPGVRATAKSLAGVYNTKLGIGTRLHLAVANGDDAAQSAALQDLERANAHHLVVAESVIGSLRPHLTAHELDQVLKAFRANSRELDRRLQPNP